MIHIITALLLASAQLLSMSLSTQLGQSIAGILKAQDIDSQQLTQMDQKIVYQSEVDIVSVAVEEGVSTARSCLVAVHAAAIMFHVIIIGSSAVGVDG